jgi:hypothetical protein
MYVWDQEEQRRAEKAAGSADKRVAKQMIDYLAQLSVFM